MSSLPDQAVAQIDVSEPTKSKPNDLQRATNPDTADSLCKEQIISLAEVDSISQVLEICRDPSAAIDRQGNYIYMNHAMRELCGVSCSDDLTKVDTDKTRYHTIRLAVLENLELALSGNNQSCSISICGNSNNEQVLSLHLSPHRNTSGEINACLVTAIHPEAIRPDQPAKTDTYSPDLVSQRFLSALDFFDGAIALYDQDDTKLAFNKTFRDIHSFLGDDLKVGMKFGDCVRLQAERGISKPPAGLGIEEFIAIRVNRFRNPDGPFEVVKPDNKWYRITEQRLDDGGCLQTMEDISEMKMVEFALRESEQRFKEFAETAADLFWETDETLKFSYLSGRYEELTGDNPDSILGKDLRDSESVRSDGKTHHRLNHAFENNSVFEDVVVCYGDSEENQRYFSFSGRPRLDENNNLIGYRGIARDITQARKLTDQLHYQARHDSLTQLMNRWEFNEQIARVQKEVLIRNFPATLGFIDLDQFKIVNDTEGHPAGDQLLKELSAFLSSKLRSNDVLARLGGDEFGILLEGCDIQEGVKIVSKLMNTLRDFSFTYNQRVFGVSASVGLVEINDNNTSLEDLIRQVDIACYAAKDLGRNQIHVYDPSDYDVKKRSQEILHASGIQQAIAQDRFVLYGQPIARTHSTKDQFDHYEILLRMLDEQGNKLSPASFIPVAERYRLMADIDRWVIRHTLRALRGAPPEFDATQFTINLSGDSLSDSTLVDDIQTGIDKNQVAPERIIFEITETTVVASVERACEFIDRLTEFGCRFAIDDFGSGMSSFSYLKRFDAEFLKIDGSLIHEIATESDDRNMVAAINKMAHVLGMQTIAEFVENQEIVDVLSEIGVDMLQGYGIGKPAPLSGILDTQKSPIKSVA